jgi:hypothetical protein
LTDRSEDGQGAASAIVDDRCHAAGAVPFVQSAYRFPVPDYPPSTR